MKQAASVASHSTNFSCKKLQTRASLVITNSITIKSFAPLTTKCTLETLSNAIRSDQQTEQIENLLKKSYAKLCIYTWLISVTFIVSVIITLNTANYHCCSYLTLLGYHNATPTFDAQLSHRAFFTLPQCLRSNISPKYAICCDRRQSVLFSQYCTMRYKLSRWTFFAS